MAETRENRYDIDIDDDNDFLKELKSFRSVNIMFCYRIFNW